MAVALSLLVVAVIWQSPSSHVSAQVNEPRFSYPGIRRYPLTAYFDHTSPNYSRDNEIAIYTTEDARLSNNCANCQWSGPVYVCFYCTALRNPSNCNVGAGRFIGYDGHPAVDYDFSLGTQIVAAAPGIAY
jgi:hypothetical protein